MTDMSADRVVTRAWFEDASDAESVRRELLRAGFREEEVEVGEPRRGLLGTLLGEDPGGGTVVTVDSPGRGLEAASILYRHGGRDPDSGRVRADETPTAQAAPQGGEQIDLVAEELVPSLVAVKVGELRLTKRAVVVEQTIRVQVRREEVFVERVSQPPQPVAVEGPPAGAPLPPPEAGATSVAPAPEPTAELAEDEEVIRVPVLAEQIVIHRRPYVAEEIVVRKHRASELQEHRGEVRREELEIDPGPDLELERSGDDVVLRPKSGPELPA